MVRARRAQPTRPCPRPALVQRRRRLGPPQRLGSAARTRRQSRQGMSPYGAERGVWRRVVDDTGRSLSLPSPPQRLVSLVPSITELVCSLGQASRLVGVTRFCTEPAAAVARLAKVGGTKTPNLEKVIELAPDLVLMNEEENKREDFQALTGAG